MRFLKTSLFFIFILFVVLASVLTSKFLIAQKAGGIYFISFQPGLFWKVDKNELFSYTQKLKNLSGFIPRVVVVLEPGLEKSQIGTGWGENEPVYYGRWKKWKNWDVFQIYIDDGEWQKLSSEARNKLLGFFVASQVNKGGFGGSLSLKLIRLFSFLKK